MGDRETRRAKMLKEAKTLEKKARKGGRLSHKDEIALNRGREIASQNQEDVQYGRIPQQSSKNREE